MLMSFQWDLRDAFTYWQTGYEPGVDWWAHEGSQHDSGLQIQADFEGPLS